MTIFKLEYPLHQRRWTFYETKQKKHEKWMTYEVRLRKAAKEADLDTLTPKMIYLYGMMHGTTDKDLRKKLYALLDPTKEDIMQVAHGYEQSLLSQETREKPSIQKRQGSR